MKGTRKIIIFPTARIRSVDGVEESEIRKKFRRRGRGEHEEKGYRPKLTIVFRAKRDQFSR